MSRPGAPRHAASAEILRYWRSVELFSPQDVPNADPRTLVYDLPTYGARLEASRDGLLRYWSKPLGYERRGRLAVLERSVTRDVGQFTAVAGDLYRRAGYVGAVDLGVVGIENAVGASAGEAFHPRVYGAPDYRQTARVTMHELRDAHQEVARALVAPLYEVISPAGYDPFHDTG